MEHVFHLHAFAEKVELFGRNFHLGINFTICCHESSNNLPEFGRLVEPPDLGPLVLEYTQIELIGHLLSLRYNNIRWELYNTVTLNRLTGQRPLSQMGFGVWGLGFGVWGL